LKVGVSTWSLLGLDVYSAVEAIGDAGSEYVELWGELPHAYFGRTDRTRLLDLLSTYDMAVSAHVPFTDLNPAAPDPHVRRAIQESVARFVDFSAGLGAMMVTLHPGSVHSERLVSESKMNAEETIKAAVKASGGRLVVNLENQNRSTSKYLYPVGSTVESLRQLLSDVDGTRCTLDIGHAHAGGIDPMEFIRAMGPKIAEVHLNDNSGGADDHLVPGEGNAPIRKVADWLKGRDTLVCLEANPFMYNKDQVMAGLATAKQMLD
jgi:fructoselysine 3-epimerase